MNDLLPYRPNVCMLVLNPQNLVFMGERANEDGKWQFPQGGIDPGTVAADNVIRELTEELGSHASCFQIVNQLKATHRYDFRVPPPYAVGRWRGQDQQFWLVRFVGDDSDIDLTKSHHEFQDWCWCDLADVLTKADPIRRNGYMDPLNEVIALLHQKKPPI